MKFLENSVHNSAIICSFAGYFFLTMSHFAVIIICLLAGVLLARFKVVGENGVKGVNAWVFYVALPALSLRFVPEIDWSLNVLFLMISPVIMLVGAWLFVRLIDFRKARYYACWCLAFCASDRFP